MKAFSTILAVGFVLSLSTTATNAVEAVAANFSVTVVTVSGAAGILA